MNKTPTQFIKIALSHDAKALEKRSKADEITFRRQKLEAQIAKLTKKVAELNYKAQMLNVSANEHESASADVLRTARHDYTKNMDDPSEVKAKAWETFLNLVLAEEVKG